MRGNISKVEEEMEKQNKTQTCQPNSFHDGLGEVDKEFGNNEMLDVYRDLTPAAAI